MTSLKVKTAAAVLIFHFTYQYFFGDIYPFVSILRFTFEYVIHEYNSSWYLYSFANKTLLFAERDVKAVNLIFLSILRHPVDRVNKSEVQRRAEGDLTERS